LDGKRKKIGKIRAKGGRVGSAARLALPEVLQPKKHYTKGTGDIGGKVWDDAKNAYQVFEIVQTEKRLRKSKEGESKELQKGEECQRPNLRKGGQRPLYLENLKKPRSGRKKAKYVLNCNRSSVE